MALTGKNNRRHFEVEDTLHGKILSVDSQEEVDMVNFLCEANQLSIINDFTYQPQSFQLMPACTYMAVDGKERCLFREHVYTPDFCIEFNPNINLQMSKELKIQQSDLSSDNVSVLIDVKGTFDRHDGGRAFSLNQKWMWTIYKKYVYKLIPKNFFKLFGCPRKSFTSAKTKKPRKMFLGMKTIAQMFKLG